jgi:hypothetical protein
LEDVSVYSKGRGNGTGKLVPIHAMKAHESVVVWLHLFFTSTVGGGECSALLPGKDSWNPFSRKCVWRGTIGIIVDCFVSRVTISHLSLFLERDYPGKVIMW